MNYNLNFVNDLRKMNININPYLYYPDIYINSLKKDNYEIIVARYNEDLSWLKKHQHLLTIYDKGNKLNNFTINIDNVGRESHTYLYHIINNWDNLPSRLFFVQGRINDHYLYPFNFYLLSNYHLVINLSCKRTNCENGWGHLIIKDSKYSKVKRSDLSFGEWWDRYVKKNKPLLKDFRWSPGGIFSVSRDLINSNSKEYYQHLLESLSHSSNPEEGHYMERSWYYIFNGK